MNGLRRPTLDESNRLFTVAVIGGGGIVGSTISFLLGGAFIAGVARFYQGRIGLPRDRSVRWIAASFAAYFAAEAISTAINYASPQSLVEGFIENLPFLAFPLIYGRLSLSRREDVLSAIEVGAIAGSVGALILALIETMWLGNPRAEGMAGNSGPFAIVCAVLYGFCVVTATRRPDRVGALAAFAALAAGGALLLSGMRSLWPILAIAPAISLSLFRIKLHWRGAGRTAVAIAIPVMFLVAVSYESVETRVMKLIDDYEDVSAGDYDNSLGQRLRVWSAAAELIAERPLLGHGPAEARDLMTARVNDAGGKQIDYTHAHNTILNAWMRAGILGAFAALAMMIVPPAIAYAAQKDEVARTGYAMLVTICTCYFVSGLVNTSFGHDIMDTLYIYGVITTSYLVFGSSSHPRVTDMLPKGPDLKSSDPEI